MYKWVNNCYPKCGRTSFSSDPDQKANYATKRLNPMHNIHGCIYNRKFMKSQKWRRRLWQYQVILTTTRSSLVSVMKNSVQKPSSMLTLMAIALLLGCCQGNHIQPASAMFDSELPDIMVPVGTAFHYKIPHSIFNCQVEHLMVTGSDDRFLPHWLAFDSIEGTLCGIPLNNDIGTNTILVVAIVKGELKRGNICGSKTFVITVPPEGNTIPVPLMSAAFQSAVVSDDGTLQFNNPNLHHRIMCFPGVHTTFASVIVNTDFNQLNGNQRITMLQQVAVHLGLNSEKLSAFSDLYPHPLISGLEFPSLVATGAGNGRFVKGVKTVFTWPLGCGAIKVNKTLVSHLTKSSQDGSFSDSVKHSIFGWHITSGVQKTLPKIRVRRAPLIGTPTPTTTVAMPTAVIVSRTTIVINSTASLIRVKPNSTSLVPINISSSLPEQTLSVEVSSSAAAFSATSKTSLSLPQVPSHSTTSSSISGANVNRTKITTTNVGISATLLTLSPGTLSFTKNLTVEVSPSLSGRPQTATFSLVTRTISVVEKISTSLIVDQNATIASTAVDTRLSSTSAHVRSLSSKFDELTVQQTSSRTVIQQTAVLRSSAPYTTKPISAPNSTVSLTSLMDVHVTSLTSSFVPSILPSLMSNSTVSGFLISSSALYIDPSPSVTIATEMGSLFTLKSSTSSGNQTISSVLFATLNASSSRTSYIQTKALNTTSVIKALTTSSSVALHLSKSIDFSPSLDMSFDMTSFTSKLIFSSTFARSSQGLMTTAFNSVSLPNTTFTPRSSSEIVHLQNTTALTMAKFETMSSTFSITSQVTKTTVIKSAVQSTSGLQVSSTAPLTEAISPTSTRSLAMVTHTVSQVLSASLSNSTHTLPFESAVSLSLSSSVGDIDSLTVSSVSNKTNVVLMTVSQESPVSSSSTSMDSSEQFTSVMLSPTAVSYSTISESSKVTSEVDSSKLYSSVVATDQLLSPTSISVFTFAESSKLTTEVDTSKRFSSVAATHPWLSSRTISSSTKAEISRLTQTQSLSIKPTFTLESLTSSIVVIAGSRSNSNVNTSETTQLVFSPAATLPSSVVATGYLSSLTSHPTETLVTYSVPWSVVSATSTHTIVHLDFSTLPLITKSSLVPKPTKTKSKDLVFSFSAVNSSVSFSLVNKTEGAVRSFSETSPLVFSTGVTKTKDLITSSIEQTLFVSSKTITMTEDVTTSFSEQSLVVPSIVTNKSHNIFTSVAMITTSSSLVFPSSKSNTFVPVSSHLSAIQSVSASTPVTRESRGLSSITGIFNLTVTSYVIELSTPALTQTPSGTQTAALSSKELLDTRSMPAITTQAISTISERTFITGVHSMTADSEDVEVTQSTLNSFPSLPSQVTDVHTGMPTLRTEITIQYQSTTATKMISYSTKVATGVPSISTVGLNVTESLTSLDTSVAGRSVSTLEKSDDAATASISSSFFRQGLSITEALVSSDISSGFSMLSIVSESPLSTAHSSDLNTILSIIHSKSLISPNTTQTLLVKETETFIAVTPSVSSRKIYVSKSTEIWRTFSTPAKDMSLSIDASKVQSLPSTSMLLLESTTIESSLRNILQSTLQASSVKTVTATSQTFVQSVTEASLLPSLQTKSLTYHTTSGVTKSAGLKSSFTNSSLLQPSDSRSITQHYTISSVTKSSLSQPSESRSITQHYALSSVTKSSLLQPSESRSITEHYTVLSFAKSSFLPSLQTKYITSNIMYTNSSVMQSLQTKSVMPSATDNLTKSSLMQSFKTESGMSSSLMTTISSGFSLEKTGILPLETTFFTSSPHADSLTTVASSLLSAVSTKQPFSSSLAQKRPVKSTPLFTWSADIISPKSATLSIFSTFASTVIPTSVIPTLAPSTGPTIQPNDRPLRMNDIGRLEAKVGKVFRYVVPRDIFYDREDGDTRNLSLSCSLILLGALPRDYWLQFDSKRQELFGLPLPSDYEEYSGREEYERYVLTASDSRGLTARDVFQVVMVVVTDTVTQQLSIRTSNNYTVFTNNVVQRLDLVQRIKTYYGDEDASAIRILSATQGSLVVIWSNDTLPSDRCDEEAVQEIASKAVLSGGEVNPAFRNALEPAFPIQNAKEERVGICNVTETYPTVPVRGQRSTSETDTWLKHVLPGILVALLLIILALILVTYLRRRRPKPANPEKVTYRKRKPIVLGEEIELKAVPAKPLILPDDDFGWPTSHLSDTSLDKPQHYDTDDEDEVDFGKRTPSVKCELPPPFYSMNESPRDTPPPSYKLPPPYKF